MAKTYFAFAALRSWGLAAVALIALAAPAGAQEQPWAERFQRLYPDRQNLAEIVRLQDALFDHDCYGAQLTRNDEVDGQLGPLTKKALHVFVEEFYRRNPSNDRFSTFVQVLDAAEKLPGRAKYCAASISRSRYFPQATGAAGNLPAGNVQPPPPPPPFIETHQRFYPSANDIVRVTRLQDGLYDQACYGNKLARSDEIDGQLGVLTKKAIHVFVEAYREAFGQRRPINSFNDLLANLDRMPSGRKLCRNSKFRAQYFTTKEEHDEVETVGPGSAVCTRSSVGKDYLANVNGVPSAARLTEMLRSVLENFDKVFADANHDEYSGFSGVDIAAIDEFGKKGVTHAATREALRTAAQHYHKLSFLNGLRSNRDCEACYRLNDWLFLRNISQATSGLLVAIARAPNSPNAAPVVATLPVNSITEAMMINTGGLKFRMFRNLTARYNEVLGEIALARTNPVPSSADPKEKQEQLQKEHRRQRAMESVGKWRDQVWNELVAALIASQAAPLATASTAPGTGGRGDVKMSDLAAKAPNTCPGFDGSAAEVMELK